MEVKKPDDVLRTMVRCISRNASLEIYMTEYNEWNSHPLGWESDHECNA